jgi:hypothetical protein
MSVGGLLGHEDWFRQAREKGPSDLHPFWGHRRPRRDQIRFDCRIESVLLISRKRVAAVRGSKYVVERNLPLDSLTADTVIFEGLAEGATRALPAASNVAASLCPFSLLTRAASSRASTCQSMVAQFPDNPPRAQFRLIEPSENTTL